MIALDIRSGSGYSEQRRSAVMDFRDPVRLDGCVFWAAGLPGRRATFIQESADEVEEFNTQTLAATALRRARCDCELFCIPKHVCV